MKDFNGKQISGIDLGTKIKSQDGKYIYHISIIDYLQMYDIGKKAETLTKVTLQGATYNDLSSVDHNSYGDRFEKFMKEEVFVVKNKKNLT